MNIKDNKNFWILQIGQFISQLGSNMTGYALILWAYKDTGYVLQLSLIMICSLLPTVLLMYSAGSIVDRTNKKIIMLFSDLLAAVFSFMVLILVYYNALEIWHLYIYNIILGIANAFQGPASRVSFSMVVPKESYMKMSGIQSFSESLTTILSPIIATAFYAMAGLKAIIVIDLVTFLFAFITLLAFVKIPSVYSTAQKNGYLQDAREGLGYLQHNRGVLSLIFLMGFINLIASVYSCNLAPMILSRTGNNEIQLGIVTSAVGLATLFGSFLVTVMKPPEKRVPLILNIMMMAFLICNNALGIGRNYYVWTVAVFFGNCFIPVAMANVDYLLRTKTDLDYHGRIFAANGTFLFAARLVGYFAGGLLADKVFEPFMNHRSPLQAAMSKLVGSGKGSGIGLIFCFLGFVGFFGSLFFRANKDLKKLDI